MVIMHKLKGTFFHMVSTLVKKPCPSAIILYLSQFTMDYSGRKASF